MSQWLEKLHADLNEQSEANKFLHDKLEAAEARIRELEDALRRLETALEGEATLLFDAMKAARIALAGGEPAQEGRTE